MKNMTRVLLVSAVVAAGFICGCAEDRKIAEVSSQPLQQVKEDEPQWLPEYLAQEPSVISVEQWNDITGPGLIVTTSHYKIHTTMTDALILRQLPSFLESLHSAYMAEARVNFVSETPNTLYLFETRQQWEQFGELFTAGLWPVYKKIAKGAYYFNGACVTYNIGRTDTFAIIAHEGWHQFSHRHFKYRPPAWLDEGMAMQFEAFSRMRGRYKFVSSENTMRLHGLRRAFEQGHRPSLFSLLAENPAVVIDSSQEDASEKITAYYSKVYALIRFLDEYGGGIYKPKKQAMIAALQNGTWRVDAQTSKLLTDRNNILTTKANQEIGVKLFTDFYGKRLDVISEQFEMYCYTLVLKQIENSK
jgi:hypothetical protein